MKPWIDSAAKTYDYLRLALVTLVLLLFASLAIEWWQAGRRLQPTISSYYGTPVRPVLVGVLVTLGVALIALKGNTESEDVLLNAAGMLAPGVAFVPTQTANACRSAVVPGTEAAVVNNMGALFVTGTAVVGIATVLAIREGRQAGAPMEPWRRFGLLLGPLVLLGGLAWFLADRAGFLAHAHDAAAVPTFGAIIAVVWLNGRHVEDEVTQQPVTAAAKRPYVAIYRGIALVMLATLGLVVLGRLWTSWTSSLFVVETILIAAFALFWVVQTVELWQQGRRCD